MSVSHSFGGFDRALAILEEQAERRARGEGGSLDELIRAHPELEKELRALWVACGDLAQGFAEEAERALLARQEVERMLAEITAGAGSFAGRYAIEGEVGQGGMGAVLRVRDRKLDRPLAMKVILGQAHVRRSGDSPPVAPYQLRRFLAEAKITSQLDHPAIVPVHEIGVDEGGRAYFTMKLVQGRTLAEVFERHRAGEDAWSMAKVLGVLQRVCEAVAFAHEHGVVHRDLKPQNIMVGDFGEVYVMDWGLARRFTSAEAEEGREADEVLELELALTRHGRILGTPCYMSPEQARGEVDRIGPPADVYAIGAMLYELVFGGPPYARPGERIASDSIVNRILAGPPPMPEARRIAPELVAIVAKAMSYEQAERYSSVARLAEDLERFLAGRTVRALRTGAWIEARKWVQRNKALAASLAVALTALVAGGVATAREWRRAERHAAETEEVADFYNLVLTDVKPDQLGQALTEGFRRELERGAQRTGAPRDEAVGYVAELERILKLVNATELSRSLLVEHIFGHASELIQLGGLPRVEASLRHRLGAVLNSWGDPARAEPELRRAVELRRAELGEEHEETLQAMNSLGSVLGQLARTEEALAVNRSVLAGALESFGEDDERTLAARNNLATQMQASGDLAGAESQYRQGYEHARKVYGSDHDLTLGFEHQLASVLKAQHNLSEAETLMVDAFERRRELNGPDDPRTINCGISLAALYSDRELGEQAETLFREMLQRSESKLGETSSYTLLAALDLGQLLCRQQRWPEAEPFLRRAADGYPRVIGPAGREALYAQKDLATLLMQTGRAGEAETNLRSALQAARLQFGADDRRALWMQRELARAVRAQGRHEEALALLDEGLDRSRSRWRASDEATQLLALSRAKTLMIVRRFADAETALQESEKHVQEGPASTTVQSSLRALWVELYDAWAKIEPGRGYEEKAESARGRLAATK